MDKKKRNSLAGKSTGKSKSAKFFAKNKKSNAKKIAYNKEYNASPEKKKYRAELNRANRKAGVYGKLTKMGKDRSHTKDGKLVLESRNKNRARNGKGGKPKLKP
jgi:hypothetical protein